MSFRRCSSCHTRTGCQGFEWYSPADIEKQFCRHQVLFLLGHLDILEAGEYPPDPAVTGYVESSGRPRYHSGAAFERAAGLFAELTARIARTGDDGDTLLHEAKHINHVKHWNLTMELLAPDARWALNYCCGRDRKSIKYSRWRASRSYYLRNHPKAKTLDKASGSLF